MVIGLRGYWFEGNALLANLLSASFDLFLLTMYKTRKGIGTGTAPHRTNRPRPGAVKRQSRQMSDIFISYSSEERDRLLPLVNALEKTGWSVFWDRTIPAGKTWRQVIGSEIRACRSMIVVWTESSIASDWVLEEAETGKRRRILIPVLLDNVTRHLASAELSRQSRGLEWRQFSCDI